MEFSQEFHTRFAESVAKAISETQYAIPNSEKANSPTVETATSPVTGEEVTRTSYSAQSALTPASGAELLQIKDAIADGNRVTQEQNDALISKLGAVVDKVTQSMLQGLNTSSSDATQNALNADVMQQASQQQAESRQTEEAKSQIDAVAREAAAESGKADQARMEGLTPTAEEAHGGASVADADLAKMVEEAQAFYESQKGGAEPQGQADADEIQGMLDALDSLGVSEEEKEEEKEEFWEGLEKSLNGVLSAQAEKKKGESITPTQLKAITDDMTGELGGVIRQQNGRMIIPRDAAAAEMPTTDAGITGAGKAIEMEGARGRGEKGPDRERPMAPVNGLGRSMSNIERLLMQNFQSLSQLFRRPPRLPCRGEAGAEGLHARSAAGPRSRGSRRQAGGSRLSQGTCRRSGLPGRLSRSLPPPRGAAKLTGMAAGRRQEAGQHGRWAAPRSWPAWCQASARSWPSWPLGGAAKLTGMAAGRRREADRHGRWAASRSWPTRPPTGS